MMKYPAVFVLLLAASVLPGVASASSAAGGETRIATKAGDALTTVPYTVANGYVLRSCVADISYPVISSEAEFRGLFCNADSAVCGGVHTAIDFRRNYVIAVVLPAVEVETAIAPVSLQRDADNVITLKYRVKQGERSVPETHPTLILIVDRKYVGEVRTARVD